MHHERHYVNKKIKMFQDDEGELKLIHLVQDNPIVYDGSRTDFKNTVKKEDTWNKIADTMGESGT